MLTSWLDLAKLQQNTLLCLHGQDVFDAHTAVRHINEIEMGEHTCYLSLPKEWRKHRAFTPYLRDARTIRQDAAISRIDNDIAVVEQSVIMKLRASDRHVHASASAHAASFQIRVGGLAVNALADTGATCSCLSADVVHKMGLPVNNDDSEPITGIGGAAQVVGTVQAPVKIGKSQKMQRFVVLAKPISGYEALLGQDYLSQRCAKIEFTDTHCTMSLQDERGPVVTSRPLSSSRSVNIVYEAHLPQLSPNVADTPAHDISTQRDFKRTMRDVHAGRQVAYKVMLHDSGKQDAPDHIPQEVQDVIAKHSCKGGTLCGDIPKGQHARGFEMHIELEPNARPVQARQYRLTPLEEKALLKKAEEFIERGWLEPSTSCWRSPVLFVPKPDGSLRFCVDFRFLNARTQDDAGTIPNIQDSVDRMQGATIFSAMDLASGFYQIPLHPESRAYTAFSTPLGLYQWCVMPMGLKNSPAVFQAAMNTVLKEHIRKGYCLVYLDDILIMSTSVEEHARHLDAVLTSLKQHNLFCQLPKCQFALSQLRYLGHLVDGTGVRPDPKKVEALSDWEPPLELITELHADTTTAARKLAIRKAVVKQTRQFLGFMQYFARFIPRFSFMAAPLYDQTKDAAPDWTEDCTVAWRQLRAALTRTTLMYHPDKSKPYHVYFDASLRGIGGLLAQLVGDEMRPVAFCARRFNPAESRYIVTEQELLAMVHCLRTWRCYLQGVDFYAHTDHEPLTWLDNQKHLSRRQARWIEFLGEFTFKILYVKGDKNVVADALSRRLAFTDVAPLPLPGDNWPHDTDKVMILSQSCARRSDSVPYRALGGRVSQANATGVELFRHAERSGQPRSSAQAGIPGGSVHVFTCVRQLVEPRHSAGGLTTVTFPRPLCDWLSAQGSAAPRSCGAFAITRQRSRHSAGGAGAGVGARRARADDAASDGARPRKRAKSSAGGAGSCGDCGPEQQPYGAARGEAAREPSASQAPPAADLDTDLDEDLLRQAERLNEHEKLFDTLFERIRKALLTDPEVHADEQRKQLKLHELHDLLWHEDGRLYVPSTDNLRSDVLYWHHDVPWAAHMGIRRTMQLTTRQFYWPKMDKDVENYVRTCIECQSNKADRRRKNPALSPIVPPSSCWRTVGVDLITDLPESTSGKDAICVFVCHLSKMVRLIATNKTLDAPGFAHLFFHHVFPHYGFPLYLISDRGPQWNSEFWRALCTSAGIALLLSTAFHAQTNGLVERTNDTVSCSLRHYVTANMQDWDEVLPLVEFALNDSYHDAIQTTPFSMNRVTLPTNPFDCLLHRKSLTTDTPGWMGSSALSGERTFVKAHEDFQRARRCVELTKQRMKDRYDSQGICKQDYEPGDRVWFDIRNLNLRHDSRRHKLVPKFWGPFTIIEKVGRNAVRLDMPQHLRHVHPVVSISLIKPYRHREGHELPAVIVDKDEHHEVDSVQDFNIVESRQKGVPSVVEFRVRWTGSLEDTWHEPPALRDCQDALNIFLQRLTKADRKTVIKLFDADSFNRLPENLKQILR